MMIAFPSYAKIFYPKPKVQAVSVATVDNKQQVKLTIQGMSCAACELEVNNELSKVNGVIAYKTSYAGKSSLVNFDKSKVGVKSIEAAINKTGYKVMSYALVNLAGSINTDSSACKKEKTIVKNNNK